MVAEFLVAMGAALSSPFTMIGGLLGIVALGACLLWPALILAAAFPAVFGAWRVGPAAVDTSLTDAVAAVALLAALPHVPWANPRFRRALLVTAGYCAVISTSVIANPHVGAAVEVVHRFVLLMGAVCIGAAVARLGKTQTALRLLVLTSAALSVIAVLDTLTKGLEPAYPLGLQKNAFGTLTCLSFLVLALATSRLGWSKRVVVPTGALLLAGLAASQSRGAGLALVATISVYVIRNGWQGRGRRLVRLAPVFLLVSVVLLGVAIITYQTRDARLTGVDVQYGSVESRTATYDTAIKDVFLPHPVFGAGPKWFTRPGAPTNAPHDFVVSELSEVGLVGTVALIWLLLAMLRVARRTGGTMGELAWYVLLARILASAVDIFWVAGPTTLPFLVLGLAIGDEEMNGGDALAWAEPAERSWAR